MTDVALLDRLGPADVALLDRLAPAEAAASSGAGALAARAWLATHGLPDPRDEAWRYTPVDRIVDRLREVASVPSAAGWPLDTETIDASTVDTATIDALAGDHGGSRLVFVDGRYAPRLSGLGLVVPGLWCGNVADMPSHRAERASELPGPDELARFDGFQALNRASGPDAAVVLADAGIVADAPIHVVHLSTGRPTVAHPRTIVKVAEAARVAIIETFAGLPAVGAAATATVGSATGAVTNAATTIVVGPDAHVTHHRVQAESPDAVHVGHTRIVQAAGSRVRSVSVMVGAAVARHALDVGLHGPGARADLDGLYLPSGEQRHDTVVTVDHTASDCASTQRFRGVIDDEARGSFAGHVIVRAGTTGTDADQSNRNLVLTRSAQADTRPWLEILADDVRCTHGATVGRLDDDALFYLRSRGIPHAEARALLVSAFVDEIVATIKPASLRAAVSALTPGGAP